MRDNWERGGAAPEEEAVGVVMERGIGGGAKEGALWRLINHHH